MMIQLREAISVEEINQSSRHSSALSLVSFNKQAAARSDFSTGLFIVCIQSKGGPIIELEGFLNLRRY